MKNISNERNWASVKRLRLESTLSRAKRVMPSYKRMLMQMKNATAGAGHTIAAAEQIKNANNS